MSQRPAAPRRLSLARPAKARRCARPSAECLEVRQLLSGFSISGIDGVATVGFLDKIPLATESSDVALDLSEDSATIDWGDGTTSGASFALLPNSSSTKTAILSGEHVYQSAGTYTVQTAGSHAGLPYNLTSMVNVGAAGTIQALGGYLQTAVNLPNSSHALASFSSADPNALPSNYSATIDWGDGTTSAGAIATTAEFFGISPYLPSNTLIVSGDHAYAEVGPYIASVSIRDVASGSALVTTQINVQSESLSGQVTPFGAFPGVDSDDTILATFNDSAYGLVPSDFDVSIDWGDGSTSAGTLLPAYFAYFDSRVSSITQSVVPPYLMGSSFSVAGHHLYAEAGTYAIHIDVRGKSGVSLSLTDTAQVGEVVVLGQDYEGTTDVLPGIPRGLATVRVPVAFAQAADYAVTVDWGDGSTSSLALVDGYTLYNLDGTPRPVTIFQVRGGHLYDDSGNYTIHVAVTDPAGNRGEGTSSATIADESISPVSRLLWVTAGKAGSPQIVASFTDSNADAQPSDFLAVIDWGDGTTGLGQIVANPIVYLAATSSSISHPYPYFPPSSFVVTGTHAYAQAGDYPVHVSIRSTRGPSAEVVSGVNVTSAPPTRAEGLAVNGFAGLGLQRAPLAQLSVYSDQVGPDAFRATVDWGDGTTSTATADVFFNPEAVANDDPRFRALFTAHGDHTYALPGDYLTRVTFTSAAGLSSFTATGTAHIAAAQAIAASGAPDLTAPAGTALSYPTVATVSVPGFTTDHDYSATIDWGDGFAPEAASKTYFINPDAVGNDDPRFRTLVMFFGTHLYQLPGTYVIRIHIQRADGATADVTTSAIITGSIPSGPGTGGTPTPPPPASITIASNEIQTIFHRRLQLQKHYRPFLRHRLGPRGPLSARQHAPRHR